MSELQSTDAAAPVRRTGLIAFGVLQIVLGVLAIVAVLLVAAGYEMARRSGAESGAALASALIVYGIAAVYFITVGIGSIRGRRWARAFTIVVSALWAIAGLVGGLMTAVVLPRALAVSGATNKLMIGGCAGAGILALGVVLPVAILLFYRRDETRIAFERLDPKARWTDRTPLPVLAIVIVLAFAAIALISNLANATIVIFGRQITGAPAAMTLFAFAALSAVLAVQLYRLKESAWWTLVLLQIAGVIFAIVTVATTDFAAANPQLPREVAEVYRDPWFLAILAATWISYFAFLLYLRRFFTGRLAPRTRSGDYSTFSV